MTSAPARDGLFDTGPARNLRAHLNTSIGPSQVLDAVQLGADANRLQVGQAGRSAMDRSDLARSLSSNREPFELDPESAAEYVHAVEQQRMAYRKGILFGTWTLSSLPRPPRHALCIATRDGLSLVRMSWCHSCSKLSGRRRWHAWSTTAGPARIAYLEVQYEQLVQQTNTAVPAALWAAVHAFLGAVLPQGKRQASARTVKVHPGSCRSKILNWDKVRAALAGTATALACDAQPPRVFAAPQTNSIIKNV